MNPEEYRKLRTLEDRHWWYQVLYRRVMDKLAALSSGPAPAGGRLFLDAGCGTGGFLRHFNLCKGALGGSGGRTFGLDWNALALELCGSQLQRTQGDVCTLPYRSGIFEGVISLDVLCHAEVKDDLAALIELRRVTQPGGFLILNLPAHPWLHSPHDEAVRNARRYTRRELSQKIASAGWQLLSLEYWNKVTFVPAVMVRLGKKALHCGGSDLDLHAAAINRFLFELLNLERIFSHRFPLLIGLSLMATARKPG